MEKMFEIPSKVIHNIKNKNITDKTLRENIFVDYVDGGILSNYCIKTLSGGRVWNHPFETNELEHIALSANWWADIVFHGNLNIHCFWIPNTKIKNDMIKLSENTNTRLYLPIIGPNKIIFLFDKSYILWATEMGYPTNPLSWSADIRFHWALSF